MNKTKSILITGLLFLLNIIVINASVMAIDYGSQWYKVSLISPKIPLELVLNEESQRKTRSIISIIDDIRLFSNDAVSKSTKNPKQTFDFLKLLVGKKFNDEEIKFYNNLFDIEIIEDRTRNSILIKLGEDTYSVEELISYQLSKARLIAEKMSGKIVDRAVITVPRFFNQYERLAMVNAAEIAGIKVLSVMNEDTAAAVNFAMTRNFESKPRYYVFFDMGASCTTISLISMKSIYNPNEKSKMSPEIEVIDYNYDKTLGGLAFDRELQLLIVDRIKKKLNVDDIEKDARVMAKILTKARKAKEILSVNSDTTIYFDSLINDQDITIKITKEEFEKASENLVMRIRNVVETFFKNIKVTKDNIDSIILVGGSTRVPMVQNVLKENIGENKLANYVNSDEAIVMGAGFEAANLSQEFKVRSLNVKDIHSSSDINYEYTLSDGKLVTGKLFNKKDPLSKEVVVTLNSLNDFDVSLNYNTPTGKQLIFKARISNIKQVIETNAIREEKKVPQVALKFSLANSDIVFISNASVKAKIPINHRPTFFESILTLIKKPHWYKNRTVGKYKPENLPPNTPKNFDVIKKYLPLNQVINKYDIYPLTGTVKKLAIDRKKAMDEKDKDRIEVDVQKNDLESLIYKGREMLSEQEEIEDKKQAFLSDTEIKTYKEQLSQLFEKLFEEGQVAKISLKEIKNKISDVQKIVNLVKDRRESIAKREIGVKQFKKFLKETRAFYEAMNQYSANKDSTKDDKVAKEETEAVKSVEEKEEEKEAVNNEPENENASVEEAKEQKQDDTAKSFSDIEKEIKNKILSSKIVTLCADTENWLNDVIKKQSVLKNWDVPAFTDKDIENKIIEIYTVITQSLDEFKQKETAAKEAAAKEEETTSKKKDESVNQENIEEVDNEDDVDDDNDDDTLVNEEDFPNEKQKETTSETKNSAKQKIKNDEL